MPDDGVSGAGNCTLRCLPVPGQSIPILILRLAGESTSFTDSDDSRSCRQVCYYRKVVIDYRYHNIAGIGAADTVNHYTGYSVFANSIGGYPLLYGRMPDKAAAVVVPDVC